MSNPFSLAFGIEPINYIDRINDRDKIINDFSSENPANYVYQEANIVSKYKRY